ncbi:MAG: Ig-like domain-containing protein [Myxococcaceae bacterium]|nr:Ig-like domain-containing protein [Myxococcaceae bacterium]
MTNDSRREEGRRIGALLVLLVPAVASAASLSLDRGPVVLGRTRSVGVTLRVEEPPGSEGRPLRLSVNVGSFGAVTRVSPGVYRTEYSPPSTRFPQVALVALWRETGPEAPLEFLRLPLYGATRLPVAAPPRARVTATVGLDSFGPVRTDRRGKAEIPLEVPPMVTDATVSVVDAAGKVTRRHVPVASPPYNRLTLALVPHALVADGREWARVDVFYDAGREVRPDEVELVPSLGNVEFLRAEPGGRLVYRYVAPAEAREREVEFHARVVGDPQAEGRARLTLGLPPAAVVQVLPPEKPLQADGKSRATVRVRVLDTSGLGLPSQQVKVRTAAGTVEAVREEAAGDYTVELVSPAEVAGDGALSLEASVERADGRIVSGAALVGVKRARIPRSVTTHVSIAPLVADGESRAVLTFDVRDKEGHPLRGAELSASTGDGRVGAVEELGRGRYRTDFTAPASVPAAGEARVRLTDATGTYSETFPVRLTPYRRLFVGLRGGVFSGLPGRAGMRVGLEAWAPLRLGGAPVTLGLSAHYGEGWSPFEPGASSAEGPGAQVRVVPVSLRIGHALLATSSATVHAGVGATAAWAHASGGEAGELDSTAFGGLGFLSGALMLGSGQLFAEFSYGYAPMRDARLGLDAGGLGVEVGVRAPLF